MSILSDIKAFLICFILSCSIYACVEQIHVEGLELTPKYVVHSVFSPEEVFMVSVDTNIEACCSGENILESDPVIHLLEDGVNHGQMIRNEEGLFQLAEKPNFRPRARSTYELELQSNNPNLQNASATSKIPQNTPEFTVSSFNYSEESNDNYSDSKIRVDINLENSNLESSYHLIAESVINEFHVDSLTGDTSIRTIKRETAIIKNILFGEDDAYVLENYNGLLIRNKNKSVKKLVLELSTNDYLDSRHQKLSAFRIELRAVDNDYINYYQKIDQAINQSTATIPKATQVPSNIHNGLGLFSGYQAGFALVEIQ